MEIETAAGPARVMVERPPGEPRFLLALTHGSGATPDSADLLAVRDAGLALGAVTALVTQPYVVRGARAPGSAVKQDAAWAQVIVALRSRWGATLPLIQGGRSNGARVVCRTAPEVGARGVLALAFPLHPPGHPERSRASELPQGTPVLVLNGERDPFGIPEGGANIRVLILPGETHALSRDPAAVGRAVAGWIREVLEG